MSGNLRWSAAEISTLRSCAISHHGRNWLAFKAWCDEHLPGRTAVAAAGLRTRLALPSGSAHWTPEELLTLDEIITGGFLHDDAVLQELLPSRTPSAIRYHAKHIVLYGFKTNQSTRVKIPCNACHKPFRSTDRRSHRRCDECRKAFAHISDSPEYGCYVEGL